VSLRFKFSSLLVKAVHDDYPEVAHLTNHQNVTAKTASTSLGNAVIFSATAATSLVIAVPDDGNSPTVAESSHTPAENFAAAADRKAKGRDAVSPISIKLSQVGDVCRQRRRQRTEGATPSGEQNQPNPPDGDER